MTFLALFRAVLIEAHAVIQKLILRFLNRLALRLAFALVFQISILGMESLNFSAALFG